MRTLLLILLAFPGIAIGQSISIAPASFKAWGSTPSFSSFSVSYKGVGVHYFHNWDTHYWNPSKQRRYRSGRMYNAKPGTVGEYLKKKTLIVDDERGGFRDPGYNTESAFAVSYSPINIKDIISVGIIVFDKPFPSKPAQRANVIIDIGYTFNHFRIAYTHISNAYTGDINPGFDTIRISYLF